MNCLLAVHIQRGETGPIVKKRGGGGRETGRKVILELLSEFIVRIKKEMKHMTSLASRLAGIRAL